MTEMRYDSPQALRRAATDRLRDLAAQRPGARLADLLRQFAYDRLLARVFTADPSRWVLKGAAAMLARMPTAARHSNDVDLFRQEGDLAEAERALRDAARMELPDYFHFELGPARPLTQGGRALRIPVTAFLGASRFAEFHVDLVADLAMTGQAEKVAPLVDVDLGLPSPSYRAYPVVDHIADKTCAMLELHSRSDGRSMPSTRYRDLVDLATFARTTAVGGAALETALRSEAARRELSLPTSLPDPAGADWRAGYTRAVRDAPALPDRSLDAALTTVRAMLDPVLAGAQPGRWDPAALAWRRR